jgi:hypothetical protein
MPVAGTMLGASVWAGGASTFLLAQAAAMTHLAASDPGSLTDAASSGGIAATAAGALIAGFSTLRYLVPLILDSLHASREERERMRIVEAARTQLDQRVSALERAVFPDRPRPGDDPCP